MENNTKILISENSMENMAVTYSYCSGYWACRHISAQHALNFANEEGIANR